MCLCSVIINWLKWQIPQQQTLTPLKINLIYSTSLYKTSSSLLLRFMFIWHLMIERNCQSSGENSAGNSRHSCEGCTRSWGGKRAGDEVLGIYCLMKSFHTLFLPMAWSLLMSRCCIAEMALHVEDFGCS